MDVNLFSWCKSQEEELNNYKQHHIIYYIYMSSFQITGSSISSNPSNIGSNVLDANPSTIFSSKGIDSYIDVQVDKTQEYNTVTIGFYRGNERRTKILVTKLNDKSGKFEPVVPHIFVSSGETNNPQSFHFEKTKTSKFRISFLGNIDNINFDVGGEGEKLEDGEQQPPQQLKHSHIQSLPIAYKNHQKEKTQDIGDNKQFFSISSLSFSNEDFDLEKIDELEEEDSEDNKKQLECVCFRCNSEHVTRGVCQECGLDAGCTHHNYKFVTDKFPLTFDHTNNSFVHVSKEDTVAVVAAEGEVEEQEEEKEGEKKGKRNKKNTTTSTISSTDTDVTIQQEDKKEEKVKEKEEELNKDIADKVEEKDEVAGLKKDDDFNKTNYHFNIDSPLNEKHDDLFNDNVNNKQDDEYHDDGNTGDGGDEDLLKQLDSLGKPDSGDEITLSNSKKAGGGTGGKKKDK